jgi:GTP cyclohydrolase I
MPPLEDTQSQPDHRQVRIPRVGIRGLKYPVTIQRPDGTLFPAAATAALMADLAPEERGTHMSRFVSLLHEHREGITPAGLVRMVRELRARLAASEAQIVLELPWFIEKFAPVSGHPGFLDYQVTWDITVRGEETTLLTTVVVPIATLCPCSKAISERGAHNQRGSLTLTAAVAPHLWPDDLIRLAESAASCELYSVLKRPDEKAVTERAFDNPVFVEDVVRNAAVLARANPAIHAFRISAENYESIHNHNAWAMVEEGWDTV